LRFCFRSAPPVTLFFSLSLHDALPISRLIFIAVGTPESADASRCADLKYVWSATDKLAQVIGKAPVTCASLTVADQTYFRSAQRSEEHTSELQSHLNLVCRLLLEKKKT